MAITNATAQALSEVSSLKQTAGPQIRSALLDSVPAVANVGTLVTQIRSAYLQAEIGETNAAVQPKLGGAVKICSRILDECRELELRLTRLAKAVRQLNEHDADLRALAQQESE